MSIWINRKGLVTSMSEIGDFYNNQNMRNIIDAD